MKRLVVLTLIAMLLMTAPAFAILRILPDEVQTRLHNLALEDYSGYQVTESWVQDFAATGREVFHVILMQGDNKVEVYVDVTSEAVLSAEDYNEIVAAESDAQAENPVYTILMESDTARVEDEKIVADSAESAGGKGGLWIAGGLVALALAGGAVLYLKKR